MSKDRRGTHAQKLPKEKDNSFFSFIPKEKRKTVGIIACCVLAVVLIILLLQWFGVLHIGGRIHKSFFAEKLYKGENEIAINTGTSSGPRYYDVGTYAGTNKYTLDPDYRISSDKLKSEWKYDSVQDDPIYLMQIYGLDQSAESALESAMSGFSATDEDGNATLMGATGEATNINGLNYRYFITEAMPVPETALYMMGIYYIDHYDNYVLSFIETGENTCAFVGVAGKGDDAESLPSDETLLIRAKELIDLIYAEKPADVETQELLIYADETREGEATVAGYYAATDKYALNTESAQDGRYDTWQYDGVTADPIYFMYVSGRNDPALEAYNSVKDSYSTEDENGEKVFNGTEKEGVNANGLKYYWAVSEPQSIPLYDLYSETGITYPDYYVKYSYAYLETRDDMCAYVGVYAKSETRTRMIDDEAIFERALEFIDLISAP